jgi:hypothetical protein
MNVERIRNDIALTMAYIPTPHATVPVLTLQGRVGLAAPNHVTKSGARFSHVESGVPEGPTMMEAPEAPDSVMVIKAKSA